jgi:hypothetical protein
VAAAVGSSAWLPLLPCWPNAAAAAAAAPIAAVEAAEGPVAADGWAAEMLLLLLLLLLAGSRAAEGSKLAAALAGKGPSRLVPRGRPEAAMALAAAASP